MSLEALGKLLHLLKQNEKEIWVAPLVDVAEYIVNYRKALNHKSEYRVGRTRIKMKVDEDDQL